MRYAIVSDIHANMQAWGAVLADARDRQVDAIICLGDVVGYGPKPAEVLSSVRSVTTSFVMGNHDAAAVGLMDYSVFNDHARGAIEWTMGELDPEAKGFLAAVPLALEAGDILFVHAELIEPGRFGYIDDAEVARANFEKSRHFVTFIGHTHLPKVFEHSPQRGVIELGDQDLSLEAQKRYIVNVGSVGEPRNPHDLRARYVIYDDQNRNVEFRRVDFDISAYRQDLEATSLDLRPYFLQVYEQVVEGSQPEVSEQASVADMRINPMSAPLVGVHQTSQIVATSNQGVLLASAKPSKLPLAILSALVVLILIGGLLVWKGKNGSSSDEPASNFVSSSQQINSQKPVRQAPDSLAITEPEMISPPKNPEVSEPASPPREIKDPSQPVKENPSLTVVDPKPPSSKVETDESIDRSQNENAVWWQMDSKDKEGVLRDVYGNIDLYPMQMGKAMNAIAPDLIPLNGKENVSATQGGVWQEDIGSEWFVMSAQHSLTLEGWFLTDVLQSPVFLFGTRTGGSEDRRGWHLDLRPGGIGTRKGQIGFLFDNGNDQVFAVSKNAHVDDQQPHHFAIVWDHDAERASGKVTLFLDGQSVASQMLKHSFLLTNQANPFRIGAVENPERFGFDELRYSKTTLVPSQFLSHAQAGK